MKYHEPNLFTPSICKNFRHHRIRHWQEVPLMDEVMICATMQALLPVDVFTAAKGSKRIMVMRFPHLEKAFLGRYYKKYAPSGAIMKILFSGLDKNEDDSAADHVKMVKSIIGDKPLMSCCSSTGPITLNSISLNLEKLAPTSISFMLENVGQTSTV